MSNAQEMEKIPKDAEEMIELLRKRHAYLMQGRPEMHPGEFKKIANRAGSTFFVAPDLVEGTLKQGFKWFLGLDTPFKRAVYMMFLIAEVHPFDAGNGRCARIMMNAELVSTGQARIIIPTIFRNTYLLALRALSHNNQPAPLIKALDFAQKYTSLIDWSSVKSAQKMLTETNAFDDAAQADLLGQHLRARKEITSQSETAPKPRGSTIANPVILLILSGFRSSIRGALAQFRMRKLFLYEPLRFLFCVSDECFG